MITGLYNGLVFTSKALEDALQLLDDIDKK